ncbi:MAG TPA: DUF4136 domain-containing protein [Gemmatimonadaceae bacterium]|nr:DUF4136 domain-containing protein [Gemmatimonadaceae bacterium]
MSTSRSRIRYGQRASLGLAVAAAALLSACGPDITVRTAASPEANSLAGRQTFRIVETSAVSHQNGTDGNGDGNGNSHVEKYGVYDPMVSNSITRDAMRDEIRAAFEARGYRYSPDHADFDITFTATVAPILDVYSYDFGGYGAGYGYGYYGSHAYDGWPGAYGYGYCCGDGYGHSTASYERSTVIIDAIDPATQKLLWRGQGTSGPYSESKKYMKTLRVAVHKVANKFPTVGTTPMVAVRR